MRRVSQSAFWDSAENGENNLCEMIVVLCTSLSLFDADLW